ncbi:ATP-dependent zinc metalloprotease FtsH [Rhodococcus sp. BP-252]|uniref:ATP-dependent zinc metalloprotease FtsH n=1 Tax=unclassified Rhodococcus (in: high G+C Gram-positive bacteria) TaxID=192944 RepID=UPI001C9B08BE|nr:MULTISPECIES: ATP-dependent zinc metalloprotease FtsH [unclassified Rhodococcus (in: high G+C Gram-positive bacteria)]MBY6413255.1 ATP-dependent zinc metalloprotease FtsH [Rhodococcus sp. BP-320]MBY6418734.1 ATP-dependent zinc metalloprotease FtsH [Rhodococcus sp. BP-321]MBY6423028.1 ATP-dependent zinc metalloprotease FtsH [Rhodococcus sp. BP-324]MBY6427998.1 ATP-dependent zinc metalloprotease FtsH [Rhodococcus sp. BP-323]MBY6433176.1 ATP-dependent zinc metalloprotease FtsH [Rhodococcus sp.
MNRKTVIRNLAIVFGILLVIYAFSYFGNDTRGWKTVDTSVAIAQLDSGNVDTAQIDDREQQIRLDLKNGNDATEGETQILAKYPDSASQTIFDKVNQDGLQSFNTVVSQDSWFSSLLLFLLPMIVLLGLFVFVMSRMQGGGRGGVMGFGKSKAKQLSKDMPKTTFQDVAGADEAVEELYEIKDFLQNPARYQSLGAKIPRGVLLYGPPGTGKTLLARAVAGEAGVPFFTISGSDFVEMFVGVGASRVRDLFEQAKQNSPCIIFVDEIDAVGRQRGAGMGGGHDEREQTLNQLLVEMDGFGERTGVILIAATNRPDILDPALLRPGRFDRQIPVGAPDLAGRRAILAVHAAGKPVAQDADLEGLAKRTVGMSGADLANVINEAALLTARENGTVITEASLEESVDRVVGGPRRKSRIISEHEKKITAYHEGGHTLAAWAMPDIEPVYKVTILARGRTGGHAMTVPEDDKGLMTRSEMIARLVMAMGGRAAEELVFHEPTTGASSDIDQATKIARAMVTEYGMSSKLGAVRYGQEQGDPFLGRSMGVQSDFSHEVAREIDEEVRKLIEAAHTEAWAILNEYRDVLDTLATELLERETLTRKDLEKIFTSVTKRPRITTFNDFGERIPSDKPPVKTPRELALERGEPWPPQPIAPKVVPPQSFPQPQYAGSPQLSKGQDAQAGGRNGGYTNGGYTNGAPVNGSHPQGVSPYNGGPAHSQGNGGGNNGGGYRAPEPRPQGSRPDYGAPAGWSAPGWPPRESTGPSSGPTEPAYQSPHYRPPQYQPPEYRAPEYQAPDYQAPEYQAPEYRTPGHQGPGHQGSDNRGHNGDTSQGEGHDSPPTQHWDPLGGLPSNPEARPDGNEPGRDEDGGPRTQRWEGPNGQH